MRFVVLLLLLAALGWGIVLAVADGGPVVDGCDPGEHCQRLHLTP